MADSAPESIVTHTRAIGIIHPPPDVRNIIDTTVRFVAKDGPEFEKKIIDDNAGNPNFDFLNGSDPYHAYYQHRLAEFRAQDQAPGQQITQLALSAAPEKADTSAKFRPVKKVLDPPEAEQYTIRIPEGITVEELEIIKLTAQFVAQNESFLTGLISIQNDSPQFHFLNPSHCMFKLFKSLTKAYKKVLRQPKGLTDKLKKSVTDMSTVLERCLHRVEWEWSQEQARLKPEDEEQERLLMSMIDWLDFVVVETIEFADDEDSYLPHPMGLDIKEVEMGMVMEMEMDEEEVKLVQEGMRAATPEENYEVITIKEENELQMRIVKNYKRPEERLEAAERNSVNTVVSPITGELIPVNEMSEHMRISLINPKFKEQRERMFAKIRETTLAQGDEISRNIVGLAWTRPDIFGTTEEEVSNAVKAEIEKKNDEQIDGVTDGRNFPGVPLLCPPPPPAGLALNLPRVPPNAQYRTVTPLPAPCFNMMVTPLGPSPQLLQMNYGQQQLYMMNRPPLPMGLSMTVNPPSIPVPPPPGSQFTPRPFMPQHWQHGMPTVPLPPMPQGMLPPPPLVEARPPLPEEPEPKKQKLDDSLLVSEDQFLTQHLGPARISVSLPNAYEGNLKGQILEITVESLSESVSSLKEKIAAEIQLPANKQKLSGKVGFLKDNLSLAYYNVGEGEVLSVSLRERGGRKR